MKLHVLFHHYEDDFSWMPNAIATMDEYTIENVGADVWEEEKREAIEKFGPGTTREVIITVEDDDILAAFKVPTVDGKVR